MADFKKLVQIMWNYKKFRERGEALQFSIIKSAILNGAQLDNISLLFLETNTIEHRLAKSYRDG